jgi:hypothetical protein
MVRESSLTEMGEGRDAVPEMTILPLQMPFAVRTSSFAASQQDSLHKPGLRLAKR